MTSSPDERPARGGKRPRLPCSGPSHGKRGRLPPPLLCGLLLAATTAAGANPTLFEARIAPIFEQHCVTCHGPEKTKAGLRLDSHELVLEGAKHGEVVVPGSLRSSELHRRVTLPPDDEEAMPGEGKPPLSADEVRLLELWIEAGASATSLLADFPDAPALRDPKAGPEPLAPDWRPHAADLAALPGRLGVRLVPRSLVPTDGLVLRTASAPARCDDAALAALAPFAELIVEAELARTRISDAGLATLAAWDNLRSLDLTRTAVTAEGIAHLRGLPRLEALNLTDTAVGDDALPHLRALPALRRVWHFGAALTASPVPLQ